MSLSADLISQFTKVTKPEENTKKETTVYGTIVKYGDDFYARIDGSDTLTPISSTVDVKDGDRVSMLIKNHTAVVTGNFSKPAVNEDSQVFKGMVTFQGLSGGTTTIDGACIKTGKIKAERLELTGAITWDDLDEDAKDEIAANGGISAAAAQSIAKTTITSSLVESPTIRGATIYGGAYYDLDGLMKMELAYQNMLPCFRLFDTENSSSIFMVWTDGRTAYMDLGYPTWWSDDEPYWRDLSTPYANIHADGRHTFHDEVVFNSGCNVIFNGATVTGLSVVFG